MEYREIVAVTGLSGLYQLVATKSDGAIVRNLSDQSTKFISARTHNVTPLESIEIYTISDNVRLHEVLATMQEQEATKPVIEAKASNAEIKAYFDEVYPDLDEDRVYISDMKKILKWYVILKDNDLLRFEKMNEQAAETAAEETPAAVEEAPAPVVEEPAAEEKPKKTPAKKKAAKAKE